MASALRYETLISPNFKIQFVFPVSTQRPLFSDIWGNLRSLSRSAFTMHERNEEINSFVSKRLRQNNV